MALCGGSLRTQPKLPDCGASTVTMQKQSSSSASSETSGHPVAFVHLCGSIFKLSHLHITLGSKVIELLLPSENLSTGYALHVKK